MASFSYSVLNVCRIILKKTSIFYYTHFLTTVLSLSDEEILKVEQTLSALENNEYALNDKTIQMILDTPNEGHIYIAWLSIKKPTLNHSSPYVVMGDIPDIVFPILMSHRDFANEIALALFALTRVNLLEKKYIDPMMKHILQFIKKKDRKKIRYFVDLVNRLILNDASYTPEQQFKNIMALAKSKQWDAVSDIFYSCKLTPSMIAILLQHPENAKSYTESILFLKNNYNNYEKAQIYNQYIALFAKPDHIQYFNQLVRGTAYLEITDASFDANIQILLANKSNAEAIGQVISSINYNKYLSTLIKNNSEEITQICLAEKQHTVGFAAGLLALYLCAERHDEIKPMLNVYIEKFRENKKQGESFGICIKMMLDRRLDIPKHLDKILTDIAHVKKLSIGLRIFIQHESEFESDIEDIQLRFSNLHYQPLIAHMAYADKLAKGMVTLEQNQMLFNNQQSLIANIACADDYAEGLVAIANFPTTIRELHLSTTQQDLAQNISNFIGRNVQHADAVVKIFCLLMIAKVDINQAHFDKMMQHIIYIKEIAAIFELFNKNNQLNLSNIKMIVDYFDNQVSNNPHQVEQHKKLLNILIYIIGETAKDKHLTASFIKRIFSQPLFATITLYKHGMKAVHHDPIPKAIMSLNYAIHQVLIFVATPIGRRIDDATIQNIMLHLAGDLSVLDDNTKKMLVNMRFINQQRLLKHTDEMRLTGNEFVSLFDESTKLQY